MLSKKFKKFFEGLYILKGSIFERYVRCSRKGCRCERGYLHGPHYYFSYLKGDKIIQIYIPKDKVKKVKEGIKNYREILRILDDLSLKNIKELKRRKKNVKSKKNKGKRKNTNV